ncbi:MAG: type III-A CRISPR-associated RAMP protein Csm5 [Promethearchaeota archaeon]
MDKNYNLSMEIITPVHIGSGENYAFFDYYYSKKDNRIYFINIEKFFGDNKIALRIPQIIKKKQNNQIKSFESVCKDLGVKPEDYINSNDYLEYKSIIDKFKKTSTYPEIKKMIRTNNKPYIPGSSLKGAIRTLYILYSINLNENYYFKKIEVLIRKEIKKYNSLRSKGKGRRYRFNLKTAFSFLNKEIFGNNPYEDIFKYLIISDSKPITENDLEINEILTIGTKKKMPIFIECISPKVKLEFKCKIKNLNKKLNPKFFYNLNIISKNIIDFYNKKYDRNLFESIPELFIEEDNTLYLCLGWGTGWYFKTIGRYLLEMNDFENFRKITRIQRPFRNGIFPKTYKLSEFYQKPLGWVKINISSTNNS